MKEPDKISDSPEVSNAIVYILRNRLKELLPAEQSELSKSERNKARAEVLCRIASVLNIKGVSLKNANRELPRIAQELGKILDPKDLAPYEVITKHLPDTDFSPFNN